MESTRSVTILSLYETGALSIRAFNLCVKSRIKDLDALLRFYEEHKDFLILKGVGPTSNKELIALCKVYQEGAGHLPLPLRTVSPKSQFVQRAYTGLTPKEKQTFDTCVHRQIEDLSVRAQNVLKIVGGPSYDVARLITEVSAADFSFLRYRQVGVKTLEELEYFVHFLVQLAEDVKGGGFAQQVEQSELDRSLNAIVKGCTPHFRTFLKEHLNSPPEREFPIWKFLELFLLDTAVLRPRTKRIMRSSGKLIQASAQNPFELAPPDRKLSKQRILQILKQESIDNLFWEPAIITLKKLQVLHIATNFHYFSELQEDVYFVDADAVNSSAHTSFTKEFLTFGIARLSNNYTVYQGEKKGSYFLFKSQLDLCIDLPNLLLTLEILLGRRIETPSTVKLEGLVHQFLQCDAGNTQLVDRLKEALRRMLKIVYGLDTDEDDHILIGRNTRKNVWEYIEAILLDAQKPLHVQEISKRFSMLGKRANESSIRSNLLRFSDKFSLTGASTYGLKIWEENGMILGGTIRSLIVTYLEQQSEPRHIYDILQYIQPYRNTNLRSIQGIMQLDVQKRFRNYGQYFFGLAHKTYTRTSFQNINRHWFREVKKDLFQEGVRVSMENLIRFVVDRFKVEPVQAKHLIALKLEQRKIVVLEEDTVVLQDPNQKLF